MSSLRTFVRLLISEVRQSKLSWKFDEDQVKNEHFADCWSGVEFIDGIPFQIKTDAETLPTGETKIAIQVLYENEEIVYYPVVVNDPEADEEEDLVEVLKAVGQTVRRLVRDQLRHHDSDIRKRILPKINFMQQLPPWRFGTWSIPELVLNDPTTYNAPEFQRSKIVGFRLDVGPFQVIIPKHEITFSNGMISHPVILIAREGFQPKAPRCARIILDPRGLEVAMKAAEKWLWRNMSGMVDETLEDPDLLEDLFQKIRMSTK